MFYKKRKGKSYTWRSQSWLSLPPGLPAPHLSTSHPPPSLVISNLSPASEHRLCIRGLQIQSISTVAYQASCFLHATLTPPLFSQALSGRLPLSLLAHRSWQWLRSSADIHLPPWAASCSLKSTNSLPKYSTGWNGTCTEVTSCPDLPGPERFLRMQDCQC